MKKRILSLALVLLMAVSLLPLTGQAADLKSGPFTYYYFNEDHGQYISRVAIIRDCDKSVYGTLRIPEEINGVDVVGCESGALMNLKNVTRITIPGRFRTFFYMSNDLSNPFFGCDSLQSVDIDGDLYFRMDSGFLTYRDPMGDPDYRYLIGAVPSQVIGTVYVPSVDEIYVGAFSGCGYLRAVILPPSLTCINEMAFSNSPVEAVYVPSSVSVICDYAFSFCNALRDVYFEGSRQRWNQILDRFAAPPSGCAVHFNSWNPYDWETYFDIPFIDVQLSDYYARPVSWAAMVNITKGTSAITFSPNDPCTRAQIVTFLWRSAGRPSPYIGRKPFVDISQNDYYYDAVLWAAQEGITTGTSPDRFSPDAPCTRAQVVTFLYRFDQKIHPNMHYDASLRIYFRDVPANSYYADAVTWASEAGVTNGTSPGYFSPDSTCTRGQIVTFLYRIIDGY